MTYRILTKKSNVADLQPHPSELLPGELALNYSDMILYALDSGGNVQQVSSSGGGSGDLVAMDYTFWVKVVQEGESLTRFDGVDDNGKSYDVNTEGFDVALNGVSLVPITDYQIDETQLILDEPAKPGDVVIIRSLKASDGVAPGELTTNDIALLSEDSTQPTPQGYKDWLTRNGLQTQQDANWHLHHKIENLDIPEEFNPEGLVTEEELEEAVEPLASREWVLEQDYAAQQDVVDAISNTVDNQRQVDEEQDRHMQQIEARVSQIESVSLDARYMFEGDGSLPRAGEFTILKGNEVAESWAEATGLTFNEEALEGKPEWEKVTIGDVIRLGGSTSSGIGPAANAREADSFAEFKVSAIVGSSSFLVDLIRSASHPIPGVEYGVLLLSSFDPSGLATTDFVTSELAKKYDKSGGEITGTVNVTGGTLKITQNELKIEKEDGTNAFRVQPESLVTVNIPTNINADLNMKDNKIIGCADADPQRGHDVVNVHFLNEALGAIETNVGDAVLSDNQTFTGINTFTKEIRSESNTVMEFKGDPSNPQDRHFKVRRGINMTIYCYAGQDNNSPKKCFHAKWDRDQANPEVFLNYIADPTANGHPVNLRYADANYLKTTDVDGAYVSKDGDEINSYLKVHSESSGTSAVPFGVYTGGNTATPKFHVTGTGSVRAGTTASEAFMAYYDYDLVTLKKLKEELEELRSECLPLLWKYNPDVAANELGNGEFNLGSNPDWDGDGSSYIYMAKLNPKGKKWYGKKGDGTYSHDLGWWGMITIWDYDPDLVLQAKAGKLHFNEGSNNYFKMHISYLKKNFGLNAGRYYNINLPGFLPQWKYTNSMYTDGNTFSAFDLPDEEKKE